MAAVLGAGTAPAAAPAAARPLPVVVAEVLPVAGYERQRTFSGELRPRRSADLGFESAGRVRAVFADEGDRVEAGAVLAELEHERAEAELASLRAQLDGARARLQELIAGPREQTIAVARTEVRSLEKELELAIDKRTRRERLVAGEFVTAEEVDIASTEVDTLGASLEAARQRLDELEEGTRAEEIARQRAAVAELASRVARQEVERDDRVLRAPFAGVVTRRDVDEGATVDVGLPVLRLIEDGALEARIGVTVERAAELAEGSTVVLGIRGERVPARVRRLVPELDGPTRTTDVVLALSPEDSHRHFAGEVVRLLLSEWIDAPGAWVPTAALVPGTRGLWAAYVVEPAEDGAGRIARRELEALHTDGERTLVRGTLRGGERLVTEGVHRVVPGQRVAAAD